MSKLNKIEKSINSFLETLSQLIAAKLSALTPQKFKSKVQHAKKGISSKKENLKKVVLSKKEVGARKLAQAKVSLDKAKEKTAIVVVQAKQTKVREINWKKVGLVISTFFVPTFIKFKKWYLALRPESIAGFVAISTVASLASLNIYVESNNIAEKSREPASEAAAEVERATAISRRPAYFRKVEKQFSVSNVVLPFYVEKGGPIKKLVIDFTFESSNKYIKEYLWQNPHLIHDTLNSKVEPLSVAFPLKNEGKIIVKDKIKKEINLMLKKKKIKGQISDIYIKSIIGG